MRRFAYAAGHRLALSLAALASFISGCASVQWNPPTTYEGEEDIGVVATTGSWLAAPVDGVTCILTNDKGTWTVTSPGVARIQKSAEPLVAECTKAGHKTYRIALRCFSPRERRAIVDNYATLVGLAAVGVAAGIKDPAAVVAIYSGTALAGVGIWSQHLRQDSCTYGGAVPVLLVGELETPARTRTP